MTWLMTLLAGWLFQSAPASPALSAAQLDSLDRGHALVRREQRKESPWPAVTVWVFVDATPEEAAATFTDYEHHANYIPTATKSKISRVISKSTAEVDYRIDLPLVPDEEYTVRDVISRSGEAGFRVDWTLVRASSTRATVGHALFSAHRNARTGTDGTLLEYYNFITPGGRLSGLPFIRSKGVKQIVETAKSVARQAEKEKGRTELMRPRINVLQGAVAP